ncbi:MAG: hypothetical protein PHQ23_04445 [Candidatus Wallbacteria bacterium]|nr:hypothetical protein [Candidatus Wallbacteria bacterium]
MKKDRTADFSSGFLTIFLLAAVFMLSRLVLLDSDLPDKNLTQYLSTDELYYAVPAFSLYRHGNIQYRQHPWIRYEGFVINWPEFMATWAGLAVLGNNFYGLRISSVGASLIIFLLIRLILNSQASRSIRYFVLIYIACNFQFLIAGRVEEPTVFRVASMVAMIWAFDCFIRDLSPGVCISLGFFSALCCLLVYPTNLFIPSACILLSIGEGLKSGPRKALQFFLRFSSGALAALIFTYALYAMTHRQTFTDIYRELFPAYSHRISLQNHQSNSLIAETIKNATGFFSAGHFRFSMGTLFLFLVSLPAYARTAMGRERVTHRLVLALLAMIFLQSLFINDYPLRKMLVTLPLSCIVTAAALSGEKAWLHLLDQNSRIRFFYNHWCFIAWFFCASILFVNCRYMGEYRLPGKCAAFSLLSLAGCTVCFIIWRRRQSGIRSAIVLALCLMLPELYLDITRVYAFPTFAYRDTCRELSETLKGKVCAGGASFAFRLYSDYEPVLNHYRYMNDLSTYQNHLDRMFREGKADFHFAALTEANLKITDASGLELVREMDISLGDCNIGLFTRKKH